MEGGWASHTRVAEEYATPMKPLSRLVYASRASAPFSPKDLYRLVTSAQARNRTEGVTGLLIYDQGRFLQWLEGPADGVDRVWCSVRRDQRHEAISLLDRSTNSVRTFGDSAMALGKRRGRPSDMGKRRTNMYLQADVIERLFQRPYGAPAVLGGLVTRPAEPVVRYPASARANASSDKHALRALIERLVLPKLLARQPRPWLPPHVLDPFAANLAEALVGADATAAFALIDRLRSDGRSFGQLSAGLIEPSARALGDLWQSNNLTEFEVNLGLGHLQAAVRRVSAATEPIGVVPMSIPHAVLAAPSPSEPHLLGSVIASELFWRAGWDVRREFPATNADLNQLVHDHWFDVLDLSLSGVFLREHRLPAMAASIRAARANSRNPGLIVIVDGRVFHEQPKAFAEVGADAGSANALETVSLALAQVQLRERVARLAPVSAHAR